MSARTRLWLLLGLLVAARPARAGLADAYYAPGPDRLFWLVHVSDSHIGTAWYDEETRFFWLFQEALPIIQPELVLVTGDLVDASKNGIPASGQELEEWQRYREIVDQAGVPPEFYIDLPGNHDTYNDDLSFYRQWSLNGSTYGGTTRALLLEFDFGSYFVYGCATPGDSAGPFVDPAEFSEAELAEMSDMLAGNSDTNLILVFGHHSPGEPDHSDQARALWRQYGAQYFHGHIHTYEEYFHDGVLVRQVNSLGKAGTRNLAVIAVDGDFVTYEVTDADDPWPLIVVTAPADWRLENGEVNTYAYTVAPDCPAAPVRALVFDSQRPAQVTARFAGGPEATLAPDPARPMLWLGSVDTSGLAEGEQELTVTASGSQTRSRSLKVMISGPGGCPEPWQPSDGGPGDGGYGDGDGGTADAGWDGGSDAGADEPADSGAVDGGGGDATPPADGGDAAADPGTGDDAGGDQAQADGGSPADADPQGQAGSGCGCGTGSGPGAPELVILLLALGWRRRRPREQT